MQWKRSSDEGFSLLGGLPSGRCAQLVNNNLEPGFSDKELHFLVIGLVGMVLFLLIHPMVKFLTRRGWELAVFWLYTMTLIIVLTFGIDTILSLKLHNLSGLICVKLRCRLCLASAKLHVALFYANHPRKSL